eukprot:4425422-Alexandrium_andersonii.AAC.1
MSAVRPVEDVFEMPRGHGGGALPPLIPDARSVLGELEGGIGGAGERRMHGELQSRASQQH